MTSEEWAYFAGILDGEGSIMLIHHFPRVGNNKYEFWQPTVRVSNTDERLIYWLQERFEGSHIFLRNNRPQQRDAWAWQARTAEISHILEGAMPYLILKWEQAEIVLEYCATHKYVGRRGHPPEMVARRRKMAERLKELNRRGRVT